MLVVSKTGLALIKEFEGCILSAYDDYDDHVLKENETPRGYITIGYGTTNFDEQITGVKIVPGMKISQQTADSWLESSLQEKYAPKVDKYDMVYHWNQKEFDALISFAYNLGSIDGLTSNGSRTRKEIAAHFEDYCHYQGKVLNGLLRRRKAERELFEKGGMKEVATMIAHASQDENGNYKNGAAGDQSGKEVCIRTWYSRPWNCVIRIIDESMAEKVAQAMEAAVKNNNIGYDQNQRNTLLVEAEKVGWDISKVASKVETDCSALVSVACIAAGIPKEVMFNGNCCTTSTLRSALKSTGKVKIYTTHAYTQNTDKLKRGDILLYEGHHVAVVVGDSVKAEKQVEEIPKVKYTGTLPVLPDPEYGSAFRTGDGKTRLKKWKTQIKRVQQLVNWVNEGNKYAPAGKLEVDGVYGTKTTKAVKAVQKMFGLSQDGEFGKKTLNKCKSYSR